MFKDLARGRAVSEYRAGKRRETLAAFRSLATDVLAGAALVAYAAAFVWLYHLAANAF